MSRTRTPQALRKLAAEISDAYDCRVNAEHEGGGSWLIQWTDGPTPTQMRTRAERAAPGATVELRRSHSPRAWTLAGLRATLAGDLDRFRASGAALAARAEHRLETTEAPDRTADGEELLDALAQRHLERTEGGTAAYEELLLEPLAREGVAPLLIPRQGKFDGTDPLIMSPAQHLTHHYARGEDAFAWTHRLRTLPAPDLVAAAQADADLDLVGRLAVLGLLEDMRRLWETTEAAAFAAAREATAPGGAASWTQIGAVLGISRQGAQDRGKRRAAGGPSRLA
ncbi:hypothetical protein ABZ635_22695 [Nocardiopsis sp. NPDC007018]|uniref:hypothetical protein n=1 Tax=Nocardiopsis sp. NPDC007018 TaxID=3155721 RepID=UPI0033EDC3A4